MAAPVPPAFKNLTTYIKRAEELEKEAQTSGNIEPAIVAYFCRVFAMQKGIALHLPQNENQYLYQLISEVESSPHAGMSSAEGKPVCEQFALRVFGIADSEDRSAGGSTMGTARTFYAAAAFLDILDQFGEVDEDVRTN